MLVDYAEELSRLRADRPNDGYFNYHAPRYELLLGVIDRHLRPGMRVLDIGSSLLTGLIARQFGIVVDTLGFAPDQSSETGYHWRFDLNDAQYRDRWRRDIGEYDLIVMAEVIEHLYTAPSLVLSFINSLMSRSGKLILQTPNAVALHKRVQMLVGRNPYTPIVEDNTNPMHFREYTKRELIKYLEGARLQVDECIAGQYFDYRFANGSQRFPQIAGYVNLMYRFLPESLKPGLTIVSQKMEPLRL